MDRHPVGSTDSARGSQVRRRPFAGRPAANRLLVNAILGQTTALVRDALNGNWQGVVAAAQVRRGLLAKLEADDLRQASPAILALRQAVAESDQALAVIGASPLVPVSGLMLR